jgi:hypothetical protein
VRDIDALTHVEGRPAGVRDYGREGLEIAGR